MNIRPEVPADYPAISDVHAAAFDSNAGIPFLVAMLRQHALYDPELFLVAESDGRVVGHAAFTPQTMRLLRQNVPAVMLAPLGVLPDFQRQGIGSALMEEGHRVALAKGFALSFLAGHPTYYPRFGYRGPAYGTWQLDLSPLEDPTLDEAPVQYADVPTLRALWRSDQAEVDFALDPGPLLTDWVSPHSQMQSVVFRAGEEVVGFARLDARQPDTPRMLLARDASVTRLMAASIARRAQASTVHLPLHPEAAAAQGLPAPAVQSVPAFMACPLVPDVLDDYFDRTERGHPLGQVLWPVAIDLG